MRLVTMFCLVVASTLAACGQASETQTSSVGEPRLLPVGLPDLGGMHTSVQAQLREAHASLRSLEAGRPTAPHEPSEAYGALGMLLMAGEYLEAAEPSFRNALQLSPDEFRWMYYLGHLFQQQGDLTQAVQYFEQAHRRRPDDLPVLIWLVGAYLNLGQPEAAEPFLAKARSLRPDAAVVRFQEGRTAAATQDYASAVEHFDATLRMDPSATIVHYRLATAHRALGHLELAEYHLERAGGRSDGGFTTGVMLGLSDPLMAEIAMVLRGPQVHRQLALEADARGDWPEAVRQFGLAVEMDPEDPEMRLSLAMARERAGDARTALSELEEAVRLDPRLAQAHYIMGTLFERAGRDQDAIDRYTAAATLDPRASEAHLGLANALRRTGRVDASLAPYRRVIELDANPDEARFGEAMALVRLGRHPEARQGLEAAMNLHPDQPVFATALARLLAASPDAQVRNGRRAFELVEAVVAEHKTTAVAETMAMALAELGEFRGATEWQQMAIEVAQDAGRPDLAQQMSVNLARYSRGEPCRTPWRDDEPEHRPGPVVEPGLLGSVPPS